MYPEKIAKNPNIDFVVRNEGEITLHELLKELGNGRKVSKIKGLTFKKGKNIINTEQRPFIEDLDTLPFPARHLVDMSMYGRRQMFFNCFPLDVVSTSRGCPFDCHFCSSDRYMFYRTYRFRSAKNVVDEIELMIEKYGSKGLYFREDIFTVDKKRLFEVCDEMKRRKIDVPWLCESRIDTVSKEKLKKMKSAGCQAVWFGVESGSQKVLDYINKGITISQIEDAFRNCKELGITTGAAFVIGFPIDTVEDVNKSLELARKIRSDYTWPRIYIGSPRSPIYDEVIQKKYYRAGYEWEGYVAVETSELTIEKKAMLYNKLQKEFMKITFKKMLSDFVSNKTSFLETSTNFLNLIKYYFNE